MFVVVVAPVSRGTSVVELSYYSAIEYPLGSFINVPMRGKEKLALVISCESVKGVKGVLRKSNFALQKIRRQHARQYLTQQFVQAVKRTALHHGASVGSTLFSILPNALLMQEKVPSDTITLSKPKLRGYIVPRLYQGLTKARIDFYKTSIREAFAANGSVFVVTPTIADAVRIYTELSVGIEQYSFMVHSTLTEKVQREQVSKILSTEHPVFVVAPYHYLAIPRHDLSTIIIERENSPLYRSRNKPFIDARVLAHELAEELGGQLYLADLPLRVESIHRKDIGEYEEIVTGHHRTHFPTRAEICNLQGLASTAKLPFRALSKELIERVEDTEKNNGRTFLYVARRGLSPITLCGDCGTVVTCKECEASVVLHRGSEENHFLCHSCGALRHARERCKHCSSWRLEMYGIGTELVEKELRELYPEKPIFILSSDTVKSNKNAQAVISKFYNTPKSILVGTEMALPYLTHHVPFVGIVSLDSLLSLASWNVYERIAGILTRLREIAGEGLMLQTRRPEVGIIRTVLSGNFSGFYRSELRTRKSLGYPPYTVIIKISVEGNKESVSKKMHEITQALLPYELIIFSRMLKGARGKFLLHGFLRIGREEWPKEDLVARLYALPPSCTISVDPDSVL